MCYKAPTRPQPSLVSHSRDRARPVPIGSQRPERRQAAATARMSRAKQGSDCGLLQRSVTTRGCRHVDICRHVSRRGGCLENFQIPSDCVVKYQAIDIPDVILVLIWQRHLVQTGGRNKKSRCEPLSLSETHRSTT